MTNSARDLSQFGNRELAMCADLLTAYSDNKFARDCDDILTDGVCVEFNPNSGYVFLTDEDYHVLMLNDGKLEAFNSCTNCGAEGFVSEFPLNDESECEECAKVTAHAVELEKKTTCPDCFGVDGQHLRASCTE